MPWRTLAAADVQAEILPDEVTVINQFQGGNILPPILAASIAEIQDLILAGGNQIGQPGTVPDQIRSNAIAFVRWRWFSGLPKTRLQSEARKEQYDEAVKRFAKIADGKEKVVAPTQPQNVTGPSFGIEVARPGRRTRTNEFDGIGDT